MSRDILPAGSYEVTVAGNRITAINRIPDGDELLGIEWAISEVKDSMKHSGSADGAFGMASLAELSEFMDYLAGKLGEEAVSAWRGVLA